MERVLRIGGHVIYVDEHYKRHNALITDIHGNPEGLIGSYRQDDGAVVFTPAEGCEDKRDWPCVNLLWVVAETDREDQYGRQIERSSSIVHASHNSAGANCWAWLDEEVRPTAMVIED